MYNMEANIQTVNGEELNIANHDTAFSNRLRLNNTFLKNNKKSGDIKL